MRSTPILLDRLDAALRAHGVHLKRSQLLETAAAAHGFHNSHEFAEADRRGDLTPPAAVRVGTVEVGTETLIVLRDPGSGAPYAVDASFLDGPVEDERRERFGPTPYGGLVDLRGPGMAPPMPATSEAVTDDTTSVTASDPRLVLDLYEIDATRDGERYRETFLVDDDREPEEHAAELVAKAFDIQYDKDDEFWADWVSGECDSFYVETVHMPDTAIAIEDALALVAADHPARSALERALDLATPKASV